MRCTVVSGVDRTSDPWGLAVSIFVLPCRTQYHTTMRKHHQLSSLKLCPVGAALGQDSGWPRRPPTRHRIQAPPPAWSWGVQASRSGLRQTWWDKNVRVHETLRHGQLKSTFPAVPLALREQTVPEPPRCCWSQRPDRPSRCQG